VCYRFPSAHNSLLIMRTAGRRRRTTNDEVSGTDKPPPHRRLHVLLIESHDDTRELYAEYFRVCEFDVTDVVTTDEAISRIAAVDVIVTGLAVRGTVNAFDFIRLVRGTESCTRTPIFVVTSHVFEMYQRQALEAGADVFLPKPCFPDRLVQQIGRILRLTPLPKPKPALAHHRKPRRSPK